MGKSFLRKIILEELQKVLKEQMPPRFDYSKDAEARKQARMNAEKARDGVHNYEFDPLRIKGRVLAKKLQMRLNELGAEIEVDGIIGPETETALLIAFPGIERKRISTLSRIPQNIAAYTKILSRMTPEQYARGLDKELAKSRQEAEQSVAGYEKKNAEISTTPVTNKKVQAFERSPEDTKHPARKEKPVK